MSEGDRGKYFRWLNREADRYNELYDAGEAEPGIQTDRHYRRYKAMRIKYERTVDKQEQE